MPQTAVVIGRAGQLGTELCKEFAARGWNVKGFDRKALNIADPAEVEKALIAADPDLVLNSAAYNQVDVAEREPMAAYMVNGLAVRNLAVLLCPPLSRLRRQPLPGDARGCRGH